jgi:hypothetical protein
MNQISTALIEDIFSVLKIPGSGVATTILQKVFEKKEQEAREILFTEISKGCTPAISEDDTVYIIYRYIRAAREGMARINLELLAKVIAGRKNKIQLKADDFLYYADIVSSLREDEIFLLGIMIRSNLTTEFSARGTLKKYFSEHKIQEIFQSLLRTGLVTFYHEINIDDNTDHKRFLKYDSSLSTDYYFTSLMEEIQNFIPFEDILETSAKKEN